MPRVHEGFDEAGNYERSIGDGLCDYEREIMEYWDAGKTREWIAKKTGRSLTCVRHIVSLYDVCEDPRPQHMMRQASADLAARIKQFYPAVTLSALGDEETPKTAAA